MYFTRYNIGNIMEARLSSSPKTITAVHEVVAPLILVCFTMLSVRTVQRNTRQLETVRPGIDLSGSRRPSGKTGSRNHFVALVRIHMHTSFA